MKAVFGGMGRQQTAALANPSTQSLIGIIQPSAVLVEEEAKTSLDGDDVSTLRSEFESDFAAFALATMDPGFFDPNLHGPLSDHLQNGGSDVLVILPRSFLKTTVVARYVLWLALKNPELRILYTSNTTTNAGKTITEIMGLVEKHPLIQALWPDRIPDFRRRWSAESASLKREHEFPEGTFESAGVGASIIRRHYDIIVEDDTVAPTIDSMSGEEIMPSKDEVEKAVGFHKMISPLFVDVNNSKHIVVGTRWPGDDLIGHILTNEPDYKVFNMPALKDGWTLSNKVVNNIEVPVIEGEPNYVRYSCHTLNKLLKSTGLFMFYSLYLNSPLSSEHRKFKQKWFQYWTELPLDGRRTLTVDPADPPTGKKWQDYSALVSAIFNDSGLYIVRTRRDRLTGKELVCQALDMALEDKVECIRVEVNKYPSLEQEFNDEMRRRKQFHYIEYVKTTRSKEARIMALQPLYESGRVFHNRLCRNLEAELIGFPDFKHDDEIDALAWQLDNYVNVPVADEPAPKKHGSLKDYKFTVTTDSILDELLGRGSAKVYGRIA